MKTRLSRLVVILLLIFIGCPAELFSQTNGTFSFSVTTTSSGGYSPNHLLAIWIGNNAVSSSASFIKTKIKYGSQSNDDHLQTWVTSSGMNLVDAVSGATLSSHGTVTFLWNGTDVNGTLVADGSYYTWLEMAWASSLTSGKTVNSYLFTKGPLAFHSTPANTANFLSMVLDWTPSSPTALPGAIEYKDLNIYPNPTTGILNINFKQPEKEGQLRILNDQGKIVYTEYMPEVQLGIKTLDLSSLASGIYYCTIHFPLKDLVFSFVLNK